MNSLHLRRNFLKLVKRAGLFGFSTLGAGIAVGLCTAQSAKSQQTFDSEQIQDLAKRVKTLEAQLPIDTVAEISQVSPSSTEEDLPITEQRVRKLIAAALAATPCCGYTKLESIGCRADDPTVDNAAIINAYLATCRIGSPIRLLAGAGTYHCHTTLRVVDYNFRLVGQGVGVTIFLFQPGVSGFHLERQQMYLPHSVLQDFSIQAAGPSANATEGLKLWTLFDIQRLSISNFSCKGVEIWGELSARHDCSGSTGHNIAVSSIGGVPSPSGHPAAGIFIVGPDANAIQFSGTTDIRDCQGVAYLDWSFLGTVAHLFVHNCLRPFEVRWTTARTFLSGYNEDGQQPGLYWNHQIFVSGQYSQKQIDNQI